MMKYKSWPLSSRSLESGIRYMNVKAEKVVKLYNKG